MYLRSKAVNNDFNVLVITKYVSSSRLEGSSKKIHVEVGKVDAKTSKSSYDISYSFGQYD